MLRGFWHVDHARVSPKWGMRSCGRKKAIVMVSSVVTRPTRGPHTSLPGHTRALLATAQESRIGPG